jgi:hypothetical protein
MSARIVIRRTLPSLAAAAAFHSACVPAVSHPPAPMACADTGWRSDNLLRVLHEIVRGTDSTNRVTRVLYHLDSAASIMLIRDPRQCAQGAAAYSKMVGDTGKLVRRRRVFVIRVGDKYVVDDPYTPAYGGEFELWAIFDRKWQFVVGLAS